MRALWGERNLKLSRNSFSFLLLFASASHPLLYVELSLPWNWLILYFKFIYIYILCIYRYVYLYILYMCVTRGEPISVSTKICWKNKILHDNVSTLGVSPDKYTDWHNLNNTKKPHYFCKPSHSCKTNTTKKDNTAAICLPQLKCLHLRPPWINKSNKLPSDTHFQSIKVIRLCLPELGTILKCY